MGRVRTKTVKRSARHIVEKYYSKLTMDFQLNKKISEEVAIIPSKRLRNKIAGFVTHLMKRIQKGPVRGISLKLQEAERERRMDFVPEKSELEVEKIVVDSVAKDMMKYVRQPTITRLAQNGWRKHYAYSQNYSVVAEGRQSCECDCANLTFLLTCQITRLPFYTFILGSLESTDPTSWSTRRELRMVARDTKLIWTITISFSAGETRNLQSSIILIRHSLRRLVILYNGED